MTRNGRVFILPLLSVAGLSLDAGCPGQSMIHGAPYPQIMAVAGGGDVDADGFDDVAVSYVDSVDKVRVLAGPTGAVLYEWTSPPSPGFSGFGSVAIVADADADGHADVAIGTPSNAGGTIQLRSGRDGSLLHTWQGVFRDLPLAAAGDVDGDGYDDLVIGFPEEHGIVHAGGVVMVVSGRTGATIHTVRGTRARQRLGRHVAGLGDVDGDGTRDFAAASFTDGGTSNSRLSIHVYSGGDATLLNTLDPVPAGANGDYAGFRASPDLDGDGVRDLIVGIQFAPPGAAWNGGGVLAVSGVDGSTIGSILRSNPGFGTLRFGHRIATGGDFDGDGFADIVATTLPMFLNLQPTLEVWSLDRTGTPARNRFVGASCRGSNGHAPRIRTTGRLAPGDAWGVGLRGARPATGAWLLLSLPDSVPIDPNDPRCLLLAHIGGVYLGARTDVRGMTALPPIPVPNDPNLIGGRLTGQWIVADPPANVRGMALSNAVRGVIGN